MNAYAITSKALLSTSVIVTALCFCSQRAEGIELVNNGGFESGSFSDWTTVPTGANIDPLVFGVDGAGPRNGLYSAYFGDVNQTYDSIAQSIATVAGATYTLSFYLDAEATSGAPASFIGSFGGTPFLVLSDSQANFSFKPFVFALTASGPTSVLMFKGYNSNSFYTLDDVSLMAGPVPEPHAWGLMLMGLVGLAGARLRKPKVEPG